MAKVYISAPFRIFTSSITGREYGILESNEYIRFLEDIEDCINSMGYMAVLPHRDEGQWGNNYIEPEDITKICCKLIDESDALVVLPGKSRGVHFEVGYATALKKKFLILLSKNEVESTLLKGVSCLANTIIKRYNSNEDVLSSIKTFLPMLMSK